MQSLSLRPPKGGRCRCRTWNWILTGYCCSCGNCQNNCNMMFWCRWWTPVLRFKAYPLLGSFEEGLVIDTQSVTGAIFKAHPACPIPRKDSWSPHRRKSATIANMREFSLCLSLSFGFLSLTSRRSEENGTSSSCWRWRCMLLCAVVPKKQQLFCKCMHVDFNEQAQLMFHHIMTASICRL